MDDFYFNIKDFKKYIDDYKIYRSTKNTPNYKKSADQVIFKSKIFHLLKYSSYKKNNDIFIIIPSLFGSADIMFKNYHFINLLRQKGDILLFDWQETGQQLLIESYCMEINNYLNNNFFNKNFNIHLVGHCIGGIIGVGVVQITDINIKTLTLLTTPWNFDNFKIPIIMQNFFNMENYLKNSSTIPSTFLQLFFFFLFPYNFKNKIDKYIKLDSSKEKEPYLEIEHWLQSFIDLPKSLFFQITKEFCLQEKLEKQQWHINNKAIKLNNINIPCSIIMAENDKIIPHNSIVPLQKGIKKSTLIKVKGGHINYLTKGDSNFLLKYKIWLNKFIN